MTISVITSTLGGTPGLALTLDSVSGQTYPHIESIVVDGATGPGARGAEQMAARHGARYLNRPPRGVYDALNAGVDAATGDIIGLLHSADRLASSDALAGVAAAFEADPRLDAVYADLIFVDPATYRHGRIYSAARFEPRRLLWGMAPPHPTLYIRRSLARQLGHYRLDLPTAADFEMWVRLFRTEGVRTAYLPMVMVEMPTGGLSGTLRARLWGNNIDKLRSLRLNGLPARPHLLTAKYVALAGQRIAQLWRMAWSKK